MNDDLSKLIISIQENYKKAEKPSLISFSYPSGQSNTTRSKSYKNHSKVIQCGPLNRILEIDTKNKIVTVEPRVTMQQLVSALKPYKLIPAVIPEFKGITVGGAILGAAAESASFRYGIFHDQCHSLEIIQPNGSVTYASEKLNEDLFWGISGSYGSLGTLGKIQLKLIEIKKYVLLEYHFFHDLKQTLSFLQEKLNDISIDFLDGIIFSKDQAAIILGRYSNGESVSTLPFFSQKKLGAKWFFHHVGNLSKKATIYQEIMEVEEYLFRFDLSAFWMGAYLYNLPFLKKFLLEGLLNKKSQNQYFTNEEIARIYNLKAPNSFMRAIGRPFLSSQKLWKLHHKAGKWLQNHFIIQDCCIPLNQAESFLMEICQDPAIYPIWLCPIKGTKKPQIFAPHLLSEKNLDHYFINFGLYGLAAYSKPTKEITRLLEEKTSHYNGRKVLYSRSYYSEKQFWEIYSYPKYKQLREKTLSQGFWHEITEKVLSE